MYALIVMCIYHYNRTACVASKRKFNSHARSAMSHTLADSEGENAAAKQAMYKSQSSRPQRVIFQNYACRRKFCFTRSDGATGTVLYAFTVTFFSLFPRSIFRDIFRGIIVRRIIMPQKTGDRTRIRHFMRRSFWKIFYLSNEKTKKLLAETKTNKQTVKMYTEGKNLRGLVTLTFFLYLLHWNHRILDISVADLMTR